MDAQLKEMAELYRQNLHMVDLLDRIDPSSIDAPYYGGVCAGIVRCYAIIKGVNPVVARLELNELCGVIPV